MSDDWNLDQDEVKTTKKKLTRLYGLKTTVLNDIEKTLSQKKYIKELIQEDINKYEEKMTQLGYFKI